MIESATKSLVGLLVKISIKVLLSVSLYDVVAPLSAHIVFWHPGEFLKLLRLSVKLCQSLPRYVLFCN